jgi:hypothetical protein
VGRQQAINTHEKGPLTMVGQAGREKVVYDALVRLSRRAERQQPLDFGSKGKRAGLAPVVERFDADAIARQKQSPTDDVPDGERPHAVEARDATLAPFLVGVEDRFGVGGRGEKVAAASQLASELGGVVDLAVVDNPKRTVLVAHRLMACRTEVHDGQPAVGQEEIVVRLGQGTRDQPLGRGVGEGVPEHGGRRVVATEQGQAGRAGVAQQVAHVVRPTVAERVGHRQ